MKKAFKVLGIVFGIIILLVGIIGFTAWKKIRKHEKALSMSNTIMENLDKNEVINYFPEKYFPKDQINPILTGLRNNCDWKNRDGKFVDFYSKSINGLNQTSYIYEYYLNCDSLRFILSLNIDNLELMGLNIEPLENKNAMILFPEKQLINRVNK